jgi:hypothetical protein
MHGTLEGLLTNDFVEREVVIVPELSHSTELMYNGVSRAEWGELD